MLNTVMQSTAVASGTASAAAPARNDDATQPLLAQAPADAAGVAAQPTAPQPFAAWLGEQFQGAALALQATPQAASASNDAAAPAPKAASAAPDEVADDGASTAVLPQDGALLAAMAMPLMPLSPAQVAQAVQAAQPAASQPGDAGKPAADVPAAAVTADRTAVANGGRQAAAPDRELVLPQVASQTAAPVRPQADLANAAPAPQPAVQAQADAGADTGVPDHGAGTPDHRDSGAEHAHAGNAGNGGNAAPAAALAGASAAQPAASAPATDTVKLAGPPTAWRQSLQEALGERMHLQVGKGIEQAVIRLEPPQLGRIDIAIRHSAGTLEVNISASNGEVLRQLQTVSDNLRSDLSQRQFTEVAVTVAPTPKNGAAPFGDPQQGRGRQQGREQEDKQPGRALAEADTNPSAFSLGGRDHA